MSIHLYYGDEPYWINSEKRKYEEMVSQEFNLAYFDGWDSSVVSFLQTNPFMDEYRVCILTVPSLRSISDELSEYMEEENEYSHLVIIAGEVDSRTKLFKKLSADGCVKECNKIRDEKTLQNLVLNMISKHGGKITPAAYGLLLRKENYPDAEDICLYNVFSDIERLIAYDPVITEETVNLLIKDNLTEKRFEIVKMIQAKDVKALREQAQLLSGEEIPVLAALLREYRLGWKKKYFSPEEIGVKYIKLSGMDAGVLAKCIEVITASIDAAKNGSMPKESILMYTFLRLIKEQQVAIQ